ncbi:hypothetical protein KR067_002091, partial [Drosophila pandora]
QRHQQLLIGLWNWLWWWHNLYDSPQRCFSLILGPQSHPADGKEGPARNLPGPEPTDTQRPSQRSAPAAGQHSHVRNRLQFHQ